MQLNGIIPVNKPEGFTSFDVIAKMRGILKMKRLGHLGTLDPMAKGVLPVLCGNSTKAASIMPEFVKGYTAGFKLGITTDTQDITGKVTGGRKEAVELCDIENLLAEFCGEIFQLPPMYSAVSVNGKRLYELARKGIEVERPKRKITICSLKIREYDKESGEGIMDIVCMSGTYVRTLIHDIGQRLGTGAVMTSLVRTASGGFSLEECITLEELEALAKENSLQKAVVDVQRLFENFPAIRLGEKKTRMYKNGVKLCLDRLEDYDGSEKFRVYSFDNVFLGIAYAHREKNELRILKNLYTDGES